MAVSKRVQVLLRDRVAEIIEGIAEEENLSQSKVCGALIEEALLTRGVFSKNSHIREVLPSTPTRDSVMRKDSLLDAVDIAERKVEVTQNRKTETDDLEDEDLKLLRKSKMLKELNLL